MIREIKYKYIDLLLWVVLAAYASCSLPEAVAMTIEAENAAIKTAGMPMNGVWILNSNGTVGEYVRIQETGTYTVVVRGYGSSLEGIWPLMALSVDGLSRETVTVNSIELKDYSFQVKLSSGVHLIGAAFLNDAYNPGVEDRNLYVDKFEIRPALGLVEPTLASEPMRARSDKAVPPTFFGMHIHSAATGTFWPSISFGAIRLWDADVIWPRLEANRGEWHFEKLDIIVDLAEAHNAEILMTLGQTPTWASAKPAESSPNGLGAAAEPKNIEDWKTYIKTVVSRYKGRIGYYEIWNEPNQSEFYSGTVVQMVTLAREAHAIIKATDPAAKVITPSVTTDSGIPWFIEYLNKGGGNYADIIGYHFYVSPSAPEAMISLIKRVREVLGNHGLAEIPLWNTESGWAKPKTFASEEEATGYVARSYILNWICGVDRFYWYAWDNHDWVTLEMTSTDNLTLKPAAVAFSEIQKWMIGSTTVTAGQNSQGLWVVHLIRNDNYHSWIVWSPSEPIVFEIPKEWNIKQIRNLSGGKSAIGQISQISMSGTPILLENSSTLRAPENIKVKSN